MKVTESIRAFLALYGVDHDPAQLETQVNVARGNGSPMEGRRGYTDGLNDWWAIRVPKHADGTPDWHDYELKWPLELHAEAIGSTGWDWQARRSRYVAFDFDAVSGHAGGVDADRLANVRKAVEHVLYVEVRSSTRGQGLHLYVFFADDGVPTDNHTEHAALARCVLGLMSRDTGMDLSVRGATGLDVCGGNMWLWHRDQTPDGLKVLKPATSNLTEPPNWRDHVPVVQRKAAKVRLGDNPDAWESLASAHRVVPLDDTHRAHIDGIVRLGFTAVWQSDHHCLQTHTRGFEKLEHVGPYQTAAPGTDPATPNCFAFPGDIGSWRIYRFGQGVAEAPAWEQSADGLTNCWFNRRPTIRSACRALGGTETRTGFEFTTLGKAAEVVTMLGKSIDFDEKLTNRIALVSQKDDRIVIQAAREAQDSAFPGWNSSDRKGYWTRIVDVQQPKEPVADSDNVRALKTPGGDLIGFACKCEDDTWDIHSQSNARIYLQGKGLSKPDAEVILGGCLNRRWTSVCVPFGEEFPGNRQWNRHAPQLAYQPLSRGVEAEHSTFDKVLEHLGAGLDDAVKVDAWCQQHGVTTGAHWLLLWFATVMRRPFTKLPYLFFWGPGASGKSTAYEMLQLLVTDGVRDMKRALTNREGFNGELENCILGVIDEHDLSGDKVAENRVKEWTTALQLSIRRMRCNLYHVPSCLHVIHLGNDPSYCATLPGDVRKVIAHVPKPDEDIPKDELHKRLRAEAPAFLRTILDMDLPPSAGRMAISVLETEEKRIQTQDTEPLTEFLADRVILAPASKISKTDFRQRYTAWCEATGCDKLSDIELGRKLRAVTGSAIKTDVKIDVDGQRVAAFQGMKWRAA